MMAPPARYTKTTQKQRQPQSAGSSFFDYGDTAPTASAFGLPPMTADWDIAQQQLGGRVEPKPLPASIMSTPVDKLTLKQAFKRLNWERYRSSQLHRDADRIYKEHGRQWPHYSDAERLFHIKDKANAIIKKAVNAYREQHPKPQGKISPQSRHQFHLKQRLAIEAAHYHDESKEIPGLTDRINGVYREYFQGSKLENHKPSHAKDKEDEHMYHVVVVQRWVFRAIRQLMEATEAYISRTRTEDENAQKFLHLSQSAVPHQTKAYELRMRIRAIRPPRTSSEKVVHPDAGESHVPPTHGATYDHHPGGRMPPAMAF